MEKSGVDGSVVTPGSAGARADGAGVEIGDGAGAGGGASKTGVTGSDASAAIPEPI